MKQLINVLFFCFIIITFGSCTNDNRYYTNLRVKNGLDLSAVSKPALQSYLFVEGRWPKETWWAYFEDEQLSQFIEIALNDNPSLQSAQAKVRQANQEAFVIRGKFFPQINASFHALQSELSEEGSAKLVPHLDRHFHLFNLALNFNYEFDFWKKNKFLFEAAIGEMMVQKVLSYQAKLILSTAIAHQYFNLEANMAKMQILSEILVNRSRQLELIELRRQNRIDNLLNVNHSKNELVSLQETIAALQEEIELEKSMLITLMGKNPAEKLTLLSIWKTEQKAIELPKKLGLELIARRPDLIAQIWRVEVAAKHIGVANANFYPNIDLSAFGGVLSLKLQDLFTGKALTGSILPAVSVPIFQGGKLKSNLKAKVAAYEAAVYDYNEILNQAANEVVQGITKLSSVNEKITYQKEEIGFYKHTYNLTFSRFKHGIDSMIAVLKADEKYLLARLREINLEKELKSAIIDLVKSLGGGFNGRREEER